MRYFCRLITPRNGVCIDLFMGSGSTGKACSAEGFRFIGIEIDAHYCEIARARIIGDAPLLNSMGGR
jgi:site-specific DNA-methyltransferase (adenine-specific)